MLSISIYTDEAPSLRRMLKRGKVWESVPSFIFAWYRRGLSGYVLQSLLFQRDLILVPTSFSEQRPAVVISHCSLPFVAAYQDGPGNLGRKDGVLGTCQRR